RVGRLPEAAVARAVGRVREMREAPGHVRSRVPDAQVAAPAAGAGGVPRLQRGAGARVRGEGEMRAVSRVALVDRGEALGEVPGRGLVVRPHGEPELRVAGGIQLY